MDSLTPCFHIPYILWDKNPKKTKLFFEKNKENKIFETASLALQAKTPDQNDKIMIPLDIKIPGDGFRVVCQKVYLVGNELLILSKVKTKNSGNLKVGWLREEFTMKWPAEMNKNKDYEFIHFLIKRDAPEFEDLNGLDDMTVCVIDDDEEFYHHLNLCAQIPGYVPLLKNKIHKKKFHIGSLLERNLVEIESPEMSWQMKTLTLNGNIYKIKPDKHFWQTAQNFLGSAAGKLKKPISSMKKGLMNPNFHGET